MFDKLPAIFRRVETSLLVVLFLAMLGVAVYQVLARNLVGGGLLWGDELVRVALLWVTMAGATFASGTDSHIRIDIVARFASDPLNQWIKRTTNLFTACLCIALGWYSITFIQWDYADGTLGVGAIPAWICELVIPVAAFIMGLRYVIQTIKPVIP